MNELTCSHPFVPNQFSQFCLPNAINLALLLCYAQLTMLLLRQRVYLANHSCHQRAHKNEYSVESSVDLVSKDVIQLHGRKWQSKRRDVIGCSDRIDFMIWPRNDVHSIECQLFSRWRHDNKTPFRPYAVSCFVIHPSSRMRQLHD